MSDKVLVTGGAGFIGSHLTDRLLEMGCEVTVLDNFSTGLRRNLDHVSADVEIVEGDIRDIDLCGRLCAGKRWVFHQAAQGSVPRSVKHPLRTHENNVTGTLNMLYAAHKADVERFVFAASSSAYGDTPVLPKVETMAPMPMSPYAASKVACENYCSAFYAVYGLPTVSLRYFNIFGPRQRPDGPYAAVIPRFFDGLMTDDEVTIFGDGEQTRDFDFVGNAVDANILATQASEEAFGKVINIAGGQRISINQLFDEIAKLVGSDKRPTYGPPRLGDVRDSLADIDLARELLGYTPAVDWPSGLKKIAEALGL